MVVRRTSVAIAVLCLLSALVLGVLTARQHPFALCLWQRADVLEGASVDFCAPPFASLELP